ncbi:18178_t:CDS:2 [Funneliformis geosporum]|uniref:18178_t:CDS:1 n=1 Tax=Funneliformis geosporum TaxID=1117311 RepID=A0A9W4SHY9_9GLOM|nr:18178_t:CDS:2 [Funneliformis geosporum]
MNINLPRMKALRNNNFVKDIETSILEKDVNQYIVPFDIICLLSYSTSMLTAVKPFILGVF